MIKKTVNFSGIVVRVTRTFLRFLAIKHLLNEKKEANDKNINEYIKDF